MTDKKASLILAQLHAAGLLPAVWIPAHDVRHLRALVAQRMKIVRLATQAKNRLQSVLHRHHLEPPAAVKDPFHPKVRPWWEALPLSPPEMVRLLAELDTLAFARTQQKRLEGALAVMAAADERVPLLARLPGIGIIGDIARFPSAQKLVGYAGLDAQVHDSGQTQ